MNAGLLGSAHSTEEEAQRYLRASALSAEEAINRLAGDLANNVFNKHDLH
jgi:phage FluMu gp28-like protein